MKTPSDLSRRSFLTRSATLASAAAATTLLSRGGLSTARAADSAAAAPGARKKIPIGIELYAVRGELTKDLPGTLCTIAKIGYEVVEFYSPYFAWKFPYA